MLAHKWRDFETKHPSSCQSTRSCGTWTPAQAPATSAPRGSRGAQAVVNKVRSLPPMSRLRLMLPCLEVVQGGRGRLGHRSPFSTCQCSRSGGASTGVDPQKERRASAANWFWQAMISVARPPAGHRNDAGVVDRACKIFEEIEVSIALAMALWSIATGPRATRAGSSRTGPGSLRALRRAPGLVDGAPTSGRRQAPQAMCRPP